MRHRLHRHSTASKPGIGELILCHRFGRLLGAGFRRHADSTIWSVPRDRIDDIVAAQSWEQVNAILRR